MLICFACLAGASGVYLSQVIRKRQLEQCEPNDTHQLNPLPPGPKRKPIVGNLFDMSLVDTAKAFAKWQGLYGELCTHFIQLRLVIIRLIIGDIIYLEALDQRIMVLNSFEHADELLSKKSYSDRPMPIMLGELMGLGQVGAIRTLAL